MSENGRDSKYEIQKFYKKRQILENFSSDFLTRPLDRRARPVLDSNAVLCGSAPSHPQKVMDQKNWKNGKDTNFDTKNRQFGQKNDSIKKRQQELLLLSSGGGRMQSLSRIVRSNSEIVVFVKVFYA